MNFWPVFRIICILLGFVGITFIMPVGVALYFAEYDIVPVFAIPMITVFFLGLLCFVWQK